MKVFLALLFSCAAVSASDGLGDTMPRIKGANAKDAGAAYGFVFAQNYALDAIARRFSQLGPEGQTAHVVFDQKFGSAWKNLQLSWSVSTTNWLGMKQGIDSTVSNSFDVSTLSVEDAKSFINEVRKRANGEMPASILATLLYFHPAYIERPEQEFMDGFRSRHAVESSDKSKAVSLHLDYPKSWVSEDSTRTGLLKRFVSQNGTGREMIILGITELPLSVIKSTSRQDVEAYVASLQNELYLKEALPSGAKLKRWGKARLEGCSGYFQVYSLESQRLDLNLISEVVTYTVFFKNKIISVSCQTGDDISRRELVQKRFERLEKLFRLVANSLVVHSKWE